jgi:hypothetical protein
MRRISLPLLAAALVLPSTASATQPLRCGQRWGEPAKPLVASSETARDIFVAVERKFFLRADKAHYPDIGAMDEGKWWSVGRWRDPKRDQRSDGNLVISVGAGQLSMRIDKCTGAISHVFFTR